MDLFENKIWEVERKPDFLKLTFHGKYTDGMQMLTWALLGFEFLLVMLMILLYAALESILAISVVFLIIVGIGFIIRFNLRAHHEKHFVTITSDKIELMKTNQKKTIMKEVLRTDVKGAKMINPPKLSEGVDILLLLLSPIAWFLVGVGSKDPAPAIETEIETIPFFEFGRVNEKNAVISFLNSYLGKENPKNNNGYRIGT